MEPYDDDLSTFEAEGAAPLPVTAELTAPRSRDAG